MEQDKERREALGASKQLSAGTTTANILTIHTVKMSLPGRNGNFWRQDLRTLGRAYHTNQHRQTLHNYMPLSQKQQHISSKSWHKGASRSWRGRQRSGAWGGGNKQKQCWIYPEHDTLQKTVVRAMALAKARREHTSHKVGTVQYTWTNGCKEIQIIWW